MASISLKQVTKSFDDTSVLRPLDLDIEDGEFVAILGPSGCGKSTTLFLLAGLYAPTSGRILFDGEEVNKVDARDRNVGIVFQSYALYPHLTVHENIAFPLRFKKTAKEEADRLVLSAAKLVEVDGLLERKPAQLSGGQQQRVALARALIKQPNILLLDEPLSNLDATLRMSMRTELRALQRRLAMTTLLVTHDQIEALTMADRIICMNGGQIMQVGTPEELYRKPANRFVASFIGTPPITMLEGRIAQNKLMIADGTLDVTTAYEGPATLGLRPEDISLTAFGKGVLDGQITSIEPMGRESILAVATPIGTLRVLLSAKEATLCGNETIGLSFSSKHCVLFDEQGDLLANDALNQD
nr:ABC transporter ATP-binding protein [uncultured Cohaesibacter sp.]